MSDPDRERPSLLGAALLADPHAEYRRLRHEAPVTLTTTPDGAPVWLVTRYADVRAALADPRLSLDKRNAAGGGDHGASMPPELDAHLLNLDPPDHTRLRRLVAQVFTPRAIESLRPLVQRHTDILLDQFTGTSADLVEDLAAPLALAVICDVLGIDPDQRTDFRRWTDTLSSPAADAALTSRHALGSMHRFLVALIAAKRAEPADDLLSRMVEARDNQDRLSEPELVAMAFLLLFAGYDNAANLLGTTVLALLTHPRQLAALAAGSLPVDQVIEETLRWNTPSMLASRRFAREGCEIGGERIPAGDRVWLSLASANRDPEQFTGPQDFRADRAQGGHLSFGHGLHYCLGAALARMQAAVAVTTLVRRFPALGLACRPADLAWDASFRNRGLRVLPITW
ncbi:cytochrome P450 [Streptacidiphilus sp. EB103A]|uniref:cytochrome P450 family protein n=1 Tax=Streptacidiphilus sp. EB103A TaxID=3156275 RepID=UPI003517B774